MVQTQALEWLRWLEQLSLHLYRDLLGGTQTFQHTPEGFAEHAELRLGDAIIALSSYEGVENEGLPTPTSGHPLELVVECESTDELVDSLCADGSPASNETLRSLLRASSGVRRRS